MVQIALLALLGFASQATLHDVDVWFCPYIEITGHTPFDHTPTGVYDARDVFGASAGTVRGEAGRVVFEDDSGGPGQPDFIEWNTKAAVAIQRLIVSWQDDTPGNNWRNLAHFWIYGRKTVAEPWQILWQEETPSQVGQYTLEKKIPEVQDQFFRAEFIRGGATDLQSDGPRICALEAYGHTVQP